MKKIIALLLAAVLLVLTGCMDGTPPSTDHPQEPAAEATPTPTPEVTPSPEPVYVNPLNGTILDAPYTGRVFASTVCNTPNAVPHISLNKADIVLEMFVNSSIIRDIALYSDISNVEVFGSVRSTRLMFNQLAVMYDAILVHSGGSNQVLNDVKNKGIDNFNIDQWAVKNAGTSYRDKEYHRDYEASLFGLGEGVAAYAESQGMRMSQPENKDYGFRFADEGTPDGETANLLSVTFKYNGSSKLTEMKYDPQLDKYVYWQYTKEMRDQITDEPEAFTNLVVMNTSISMNNIYHVADFQAGGDGYFACGGKLVPITWTCAGNDQPIQFFRQDGSPLELERGNTYIAIAPNGSEIYWE